MKRDERILWMKEELARLAENPLDDTPRLEEWFLTDSDPRPAVVICPGGGYGFTSPRESGPVARAYNERGYHALVLHYRVDPHRYPEALLDLSRTMALIRLYAADLGIISDRVALCGFSAGGHLAASLGVHWNKPFLSEYDIGLNRPDCLILSYPVITAGEFRHRGSFDNLLGADHDPELRDFHSLEKHVTERTPPAFLWHTQNDESVPVENSLLFAHELHRAGVVMEMHIYPFGSHGSSLAKEETDTPEKKYADPHLATWLDLSVRWLEDLFRG